jgi:hypothetical protein
LQFFQAALALMKAAIYEGMSQDQVSELFPEHIDPDLVAMISDVVAGNVESWSQSVTLTQPSIPKLVDMDWRIDVITGTGDVSRMALPSAMVQLELQNAQTQVGVMPDVESHVLELNKGELQTILDGLEKIQETLSKVK